MQVFRKMSKRKSHAKFDPCDLLITHKTDENNENKYCVGGIGTLFRYDKATNTPSVCFIPKISLADAAGIGDVHLVKVTESPIDVRCHKKPIAARADMELDVCFGEIWKKPRNPLIGIGKGLEGRSKFATTGIRVNEKKVKISRKDGNPVTGEGYKGDVNHSTPAYNGANEMIKKNRVPPGGFSSGLW